MNNSLAYSPTSLNTIPSAQVGVDGVPRFQIPAQPNHPEWAQAAEAEAAGGASAEIRAFLDAQLESGDVLLDLAPGFGFVALSATTAPGGLPTVFVGGLDESQLQLLQDAAVDVGGWLESVSLSDLSNLGSLLDMRLDPDGRVFVHLRASDVATTCAQLEPLLSEGRVLALCITDAQVSSAWTDAEQTLQRVGMTACVLVEQEGDAVMMRLDGAPWAPAIALPAALVSSAPAAEAMDEVFPASFPTQVAPAATCDDSELDVVRRPIHADAPREWQAMRDGFSLISSHSRTGYGVAGAHLLRALQQRGAPVAFFPMGAVDRTLADNPQLHKALNLQDAFRSDVPSVRISQQFDLALHVGRGAHVAFTIFELDTFTARELHHLRSQDAIFVCSDWARQVCLDNGILDTPIHVVPLGVDRAVFNAQVSAPRRWPDTVFMQVGKLEPRKGQRELLRAFEAAFTPKDRVRLVLSCGNPFVTRAEFDAMVRPFRSSPMAQRISIMTDELPSQRDVAALMASADCGVFAARAEGWNLEALEMLAMGKSVIATDYAAHTAFLTAENARLIGIDALDHAHPGAHPGRWAAWGDAQHEQLVLHLRAVHAEREAGALVFNETGVATSRTFSWEGAADALIRSLYAIA